MTDESKLGVILSKEGFNLQNGSCSIRPDLGFPLKYNGLNSLLDTRIDMGAEELIVKITKIKDSQVYMCDFYIKK